MTVGPAKAFPVALPPRAVAHLANCVRRDDDQPGLAGYPCPGHVGPPLVAASLPVTEHAGIPGVLDEDLDVDARCRRGGGTGHAGNVRPRC